jgi:hypothetical protein
MCDAQPVWSRVTNASTGADEVPRTVQSGAQGEHEDAYRTYVGNEG